MTQKTMNLLSLINAKKDLSPETFQKYLEKLRVSIKPAELDDITALVNGLKSITKMKKIFNCYYIGFTIKQIGKEFDLLRLGTNYHINIELKRKSTREKIQKQLIKNKYYLNSLGEDAYNFTYITSEDKLYFLNEDNSISESSFEFLNDKITHQDILEVEDINTLFDPTNYLVSPFNSTERFIENKYFLTQLQESIKEELFKLDSNNQKNLFAIEGAAGTGKTLLVYDIAKQYKDHGKEVAILHCGNLNNGHDTLNDNYSWSIYPVKGYKTIFSGQFDVIVIDEIQRIYKEQLEKIVKYAIKEQITCVFSFDPKQCLSISEINRNIPGYLDTIVDKKFVLTQKIRTNPEISTFIKNLFSRSNRTSQQKYDNIEIQYFSSIKEANSMIRSLKSRGWVTINYTVSQYNWSSLDNIMVRANENAHSVIGQEYDNVIAVIGETFTYDSNGKLVGDRSSYYHPTKMLFQILTRTRKKLCLIIVDNEVLLKECLKILG
ncbi:ATP-binding protein [Bacillus cereus]|uniref:AAA domain protein n=1 Tax=Bacillus cereus 03BB108 TaxID=451709 RepID=A0AAN0W4A9_BACCE|nr:ATP-binding protein [Bacillus cereus]AJI08604.1 AAA domain protein [Bacillus cereus 03BB108]EDX60206.1 conserved hypothetical protein [Bacillus cereus 03BB108]QKH04607.1 ATP-binding protein [Bacillus cereus]